jgi:hypothetical protein
MLLLGCYFPQPTRLNVVDKPPYRDAARYPRMRSHLADLLAHVLFQIREGVGGLPGSPPWLNPSAYFLFAFKTSSIADTVSSSCSAISVRVVSSCPPFRRTRSRRGTCRQQPSDTDDDEPRSKVLRDWSHDAVLHGVSFQALHPNSALSCERPSRELCGARQLQRIVGHLLIPKESSQDSCN